jgi:tetratricopeptide (TPR) repeat protein
LLFKQADVWEKKIEDRYEAIGCYKAVREIDPNDKEALAALDRLYEAEKMWADLLEILEARIQLEANPAAREELRFRSAVVTEEESGEVDRAIERYRAVLDAVPEHQGARDRLFALVRAEGTREPAAAALEPYLRARKEWPRLVEIIELRIEAESDAAHRRQLLADLAQLHEQGKSDLQAAFAAWGRVLGEDAGDTEAQRELERIASARGGFADLAALYEDRLANQYDAEIGRQLALKLATIYEDALGDAASAVDKLRQALDYPGDERGPLAALDRLLETLGRWPELAEILEREAQAGLEPAEQAGYLYRLGLLRLERLTDHDGAIEAWRDVLERDPNHDGAIDGIARYLDDATYREQAIDILEPAYESRADHKNLVRVLEVKLQVTEEPLERARLLERIAELQEKELRQNAAALDAWARALMEDPSELRYADEVARLGDALGMPGEAAGRIERVAEASEEKSKEAARDLGLRAGAIWLGKARDLGRAESRYRRVLSLDAENQDALEALDQIARAKGDDGSLVDMLSRRAALELDIVKKRELYAEAAQIAEQKLRDPKAAIDAWKSVVEGDDTDAAAQGELARLYEAAGDWTEHAQALERQARVTDDGTEQSALYARAGSVWMGRLNDADHAAEAYRSALDAKAGDPDVLRALEEVHTRRGDWLAVQEVLTQQLQSAGSPAEQVATYAKLARLAEEKNESVDEATGFWTQALDADPSNERVFAELERLLQAGEKWYELADVLGKHADLCAQRGDGGGELAKLLMIADVWERRIGNSDSAAEILEKVLERDPRNVSAMTQLARMYESAGEWDKCATTLERAAALGPTGGPAAELYFRMGKVEVERGGGDETKAEPHWTRALQFDAGHAEALEGLERLARGRSDWRRVVQLLDLREKGERDNAKKRDLLAEIGKLLRTELKAPQEALGYLERAVSLAPDDARVAEPLADAYFAAGRMAEAGKLYAGLLERLKGKKSKEVARLTFRLGAIAEQAGQAAQATEYFNHAFTIDPTHGPTMAALGRLYQSQQDWEKARKVYRSMLLQNLDAETGMSKADVYLELGRIHARLGEVPKARNMYERGLEGQPDHAGLKEALAELR